MSDTLTAICVLLCAPLGALVCAYGCVNKGGGGGGGFGSPSAGGGGYMAGGASDSPAGGGSGGGQRNKEKQSILAVNVKQARANSYHMCARFRRHSVHVGRVNFGT